MKKRVRFEWVGSTLKIDGMDVGHACRHVRVESEGRGLAVVYLELLADLHDDSSKVLLPHNGDKCGVEKRA